MISEVSVNELQAEDLGGLGSGAALQVVDLAQGLVVDLSVLQQSQRYELLISRDEAFDKHVAVIGLFVLDVFVQTLGKRLIVKPE